MLGVDGFEFGSVLVLVPVKQCWYIVFSITDHYIFFVLVSRVYIYNWFPRCGIIFYCTPFHTFSRAGVLDCGYRMEEECWFWRET
jgi:hypothetical protein